MSKRGRFPASSFMQILISFVKCVEDPGGICTRKPSVAILIPHSIGDELTNGISLVINSQTTIAKLHMSQASQFRSARFLCNASGDIQAGW